MTSIDAPADVRAEWAREHGIDGVDGPEWDDDVAAIETRARRRAGRRRAAEGRGDPARGGRARLGGGADPAQRDRLRRLRALPVRLPARDEAVGDPGRISRRRSRPGRGSSTAPRDVGARRGRAGASGVVAEVAPTGDGSTGGDGRPRRLVVRASQVVLAAGALRTPTILAGVGPRPTRRSAGICGSTPCR